MLRRHNLIHGLYDNPEIHACDSCGTKLLCILYLLSCCRCGKLASCASGVLSQALARAQCGRS